jgi:site-specific recombinase XerD
MSNEYRMLYIGYWLRRFLSEYLVTVRNMSKNTIKSYRDTFKLLLPFAAKPCKKATDDLLLTDISMSCVVSFLNMLEKERKCTIRTRNQRLAAIHAFAKYVSIHSPDHLEWCASVNTIPIKKASRRMITYLEKEEMDALLAAPNPNTEQGYRDYAMLLFMYNAGTRADETANMRIGDLQLPRGKKGTGLVTITGKGQKTRMCPLWAKTCRVLRNLIGTRGESEFLFTNRFGNPITRYGIYEMVTKYGKAIESQYPAVKEKRLSPHTIRHTTASHLLQAGVDINTIRAWLGHVSIETTNQYAEINMKMKIEAIEKCNIVNVKIPKRHWRDDKGLMDFLISI